MAVDEITNYYDTFRDVRMSRYRILGNRRLKLAAELAKSLTRDGDVAADFGCGIGIVAEELARAKPKARVVAIDISPANIQYACRTVKLNNVEFVTVGIHDGCEALRKVHPEGYNVITLVDVIEHIRTEQRPELFRELAGIAADNAYLVLTYPSPEYQRYLQKNIPDELQIIDNVLEQNTLLSETKAAGWVLKTFQYKDVWMSNQYVHAVFQYGDAPFETSRIQRPVVERFIEILGVGLCFPYRVWRYGWPSFKLRK